MEDVKSGQYLLEAAEDRSAFAPQVQGSTAAVTQGLLVGQGLQAPRAASPSSASATGPRSATSPALRSPASWFNCSTSSAGGSHIKHSLLAMVPSQPLTRPTASAPPSPVGQLQPPTIPALDQLKQPETSGKLPASSTVSATQLPVAAQLEDQAAAQNHRSEADGNIEADNQQSHVLNNAQASVSKQVKRDKRMRKTEANMRWQLMRKLADISADVELLNHEVARIRYGQSSALLAEEQRELSESEEQQLESLHQKRLADLVVRQCATSLKSVTGHKWAFPFAKPVDVNLFKQYPVIIQHPMDFATIKAKVDGGAYKGPHLFYDDMKLVFANARRFNPPGSDVYLMASGVEEKFEERWQALLAPKLGEEEAHMRTDAAAIRKQRMDHAQARSAGELEQHRLRMLSVFDNLHSRIMDAKTLAAAACKPVSQHDKEALLPALESLSPEQFEWAMSLVHARYPGLPTGPGEEMQFDITCLDSLALRQLMDLTQACARAAKMAEGGEAQVTWPANPVGVGSRGHKPAPNTQARRSPTPPTPLSARLTAKAPPALPVEPRSTVHPMSQSQLLRHGLELAQPSRAISLQPSTAPQLPISHPAPAPAAGPSQPLVSAALTPLLQSSQQAVVGPPDSITTQARFSVDNAQTASAAHTALTPTSALPASAPAGDAAEPSQRLMAAAHQPDNRLASAASGEPGSTALADTNPQAEASKQHAEAEAAVNHAVACCSEVHHNGADMLKQDDHLARDNALASDQPHGALPLNVADFNGVTGRLRPASPDIGFHGASGLQASMNTIGSHAQHNSPAPDAAHHEAQQHLSPLHPVATQAADPVQTGLHSADIVPHLQQLLHQPAHHQAELDNKAAYDKQGMHAQEINPGRSLHQLPAADATLDPAQATVVHSGPTSSKAVSDLESQPALLSIKQQQHTPVLRPAALSSSQAGLQQQQPQHEEGSQERMDSGLDAQGAVAAAVPVHSFTAGDAQQALPEDDAEAVADDTMDFEPETSPEKSDSADTAEGGSEQAGADVRRSAQPSRRRQAPQRRSTTTPLASKASTSRKAAGKTGKSRAATLAARNASAKHPRRSTSRSTAGKRRRSPS